MREKEESFTNTYIHLHKMIVELGKYENRIREVMKKDMAEHPLGGGRYISGVCRKIY